MLLAEHFAANTVVFELQEPEALRFLGFFVLRDFEVGDLTKG
jgi:hypothetical protein